MPIHRWTIAGQLSGAFYIESKNQSSNHSPPVPGVESVRVSPELNESGHFTGNHRVDATIGIESEGEDHELVLDRAHDLLSSVAAIATFTTGRPIRVLPGVSATRELGGTPPRFRRLTRGIQTPLPEPVPLSAGSLVHEVDPVYRRAIGWWSRGLTATDHVERLVAMTNALDLMAGTVEGAPSRTRRCSHCGAADIIGPGLRERVIHLLVGLGFNPERANEIYERRVDMAHARSNLTEAELRTYRDAADDLAEAVRRALADGLDLDLPPSPVGLPIVDPILAIEFIGSNADPDSRVRDEGEPVST